MHKHVKNTFVFAKKTVREKSFHKYIFVGVSTVIIDYSLLFLLHSQFKNGIFSAVSIAYWTSIVYSFLINKYWTFKSSGGIPIRQLLQYVLLLIFNYLITLGIITGLKTFSVGEYTAKLLALVQTISWTYFIYKKIFK